MHRGKNKIFSNSVVTSVPIILKTSVISATQKDPNAGLHWDFLWWVKLPKGKKGKNSIPENVLIPERQGTPPDPLPSAPGAKKRLAGDEGRSPKFYLNAKIPADATAKVTGERALVINTQTSPGKFLSLNPGHSQ